VQLHYKTRAGSHVYIQIRIYVRQGSDQPHQATASSNLNRIKEQLSMQHLPLTRTPNTPPSPEPRQTYKRSSPP